MPLDVQPRVTSPRRADASPDRPPAARRHPGWPAVAGIVILAGALRFGALGAASLWFDEVLVARLAQLRWSEITTVLATRDVHPPLYFWLMKAWTGLAGTSEVALRLPSAFAGVLSVLLTYFVMRQVASEGESLLGALLVSLSPFDVMAAQEARMYALLETLALASTLALILGVRRGGIARWTGYAALAAAMIYTHNLGLLVLAAHGLWIAGFERSHLRAWLWAAGGAIVLYAPWLPSLWQQTTVVELHRMWYRHPVGSADLAGLFGLFAFGGSLFGMPSFFGNGSLHPAVQWLVVVPFLFLIGRGVLAKWADPRGRALLGACLGLPMGTMFLLSFVKPVFYARWFSFLLPFYAMFAAAGLVDTAKGFPTRRTVLGVLVAGVLLCGIPVLTRYYADPGFRPYRWRAAAALVQAEARPQDFILYVHSAAEISFGYYFHQPHPSLTLNPIEAFGEANVEPGFRADQARTLAARYPRGWLIIMTPFDQQMGRRLLPALGSAFQLRELHDFGNLWVIRLEANP